MSSPSLHPLVPNTPLCEPLKAMLCLDNIYKTWRGFQWQHKCLVIDVWLENQEHAAIAFNGLQFSTRRVDCSLMKRCSEIRFRSQTLGFRWLLTLKTCVRFPNSEEKQKAKAFLVSFIVFESNGSVYAWVSLTKTHLSPGGENNEIKTVKSSPFS